ncbi:hypothetical protein, partial, partial [Parasitella parasitica]
RVCRRIFDRVQALNDNIDENTAGAANAARKLSNSMQLEPPILVSVLLRYMIILYHLGEVPYPQEVMLAGITHAFDFAPPQPISARSRLVHEMEAHSVLAQRLIRHLFKIGLLILQE